ncbi:MAG: TonB-dependent receptor, partial [Terracidiphilus sp.]
MDNLSSVRRLTSALTLAMAMSFVQLLACNVLGFGQGIITGSIDGAVTDNTGAVIPAATVTVVNETTGSRSQVKTNAEGLFRVSDVPVGSYTITVTANGFSPDVVSHVHVVAGNSTSLGKRQLNLAGATQTVQVEAGAAQLVNTESAQGELTIDSAQLQTLPVNGAFDNVTLMVPGVVATHSDGMSNTNGVNFSVNGERGRANNFEIDGQSNNDNSIAGPSFFFSNLDALQEIQVVTNNFSAQYGRNMGSVVNYITKTGTNSFHGSAFEMYTGSFLSSLMQFQKDPQFGFCAAGVSPTTGCTAVFVPRFDQNNYGGTVGGPILKDKLFFFGGTYWTHQYQSGTVDTSDGALSPDPTGLTQLQAAFPSNPGVAALVAGGPYSVKTGIPTPIGSTVTTIPVTDGATIQNIEVSQYQRSLDQYTLDQEELGRLDYQMTSKDRMFLRYNYQNNPTIPGLYLTSGAAAASGAFYNVNGITHEVGADWTHDFTSRLVNQLRYAFQQSTIAFQGGAVPDCTISNFAPCPSPVALGSGLAGFGYNSAFPEGRVIKVNQTQDNASWTSGRHTIQFGGEFDHQDSPNVFLPSYAGGFNFGAGAAINSTYPNGIPFRNTGSNAALNNGLTGLLEGVSGTTLAIGNTSIPFKEPDYGLYFQDDWRFRPNLTLNLGLRYEFFSQSVNLLHNESVAQQTGPNPFWNTSLPLSATTFPKI